MFDLSKRWLEITTYLTLLVRFPSTYAEQKEITQSFFQVGGFPCAIGGIDGTHVRITAPQENEPDFVNRKGFHSINVQAICNLWGKLISLTLIGLEINYWFRKGKHVCLTLSFTVHTISCV